VIAAGKVTLECPDCNWVFEAKRPDSRHSLASLEKPQKGNISGDIKEENYVCRNPRCKKAFTVYWFEPLRFFE
jgi:rubredoxin